jgi:diguanylate cyclase (GGDEF)-like protein
MKLRNKVLIAIGLAWAAFLIVTYIGSRTFLEASFLQLEQERIERDLARIDQALIQVNYSLFTFTADWAHWNDLYRFMQDKNPRFPTNNLTLTAFVNSTINLLTYWNKQDKLIVGMAIDTDHPRFIPLPAGLNEYIHPNNALFTKKETSGLILLSNGIMLIATNYISDSEKTAPILGTILTGRYLSPQIIKQLEKTTRLHLQLHLPADIAAQPALQISYQQTMQSPSQHVSHSLDNNTTEAFTLLTDINHKPIGMFQITTPRLIYLAGMKAIHYFLISFAILAVVFSLLMLWLLRILIIKRLEKLDADVANITAQNKISERVNAEGHDELSSVATEINCMLDTIEVSHDELEERVKQRTIELQETNTKLQTEITERKSVESELLVHKENLIKLAHYDNLTSLPNRIFFNEIFTKALSHASRQQKSLALLYIDIDRFKNINDALGHPTGDLVLKEIAHRFSSVLRAGDIIARLGGDEFIILLSDIIHPKFASPVAEKLLQTCAQPININNHEFFLTTSIGICVFPNDGASIEDLQRNADMAMYKAKRSGGGVFQYFTKEMNLEAHAHIQLEAALRKAINNNEFILHYQPKFNIATQSMMGVEALIRWNHPEQGLVSPIKFIPLAEETGLIMQIGEWALREACKTNKSWQNQGFRPITVAVNISPKQFRHQDIAQLVSTILTETELEPKYLELEITETAVMDNVDSAISRLNDIRNMGVEISVDDFGTGYTSISYLKKFPVNNLKIDQSFIMGIPDNQNDVAITSAVIAMAHNLDLKVVAEGVETAEQLAYLKEHQCDMVQGYFLSRPLTEEKIVEQFVKLDAVK